MAGDGLESSRQTLIVDPGAYSIKAGFAPGNLDASSSSSAAEACRIIPNCIAKSRDKHVYVGSALDKCTDYGEMVFKRPVEKGYIVNWEAERAIWEHEFFQDGSPTPCDPHQTTLLLTEAPNAIRALQSNTDQIIFEAFEFAAAYRTVGARLNAWNPPADNPGAPLTGPAEAMLVIDCSHSHTTIVPLLHGRPVESAIRRCSPGGKHLTNYLAELISLRHFSLIDEPFICEQIKRDVCFVSADFAHDLAAVRQPDNTIVVDYVLPDYETIHRGYTQVHNASHAAKLARLGIGAAVSTASSVEHQQRRQQQQQQQQQQRQPERLPDSFPLGNERFTVPEILFRPSDINLRDEQGLPETVMQSLGCVPRPIWPALLGNVRVVGGTSLTPGFTSRLECEMRALAPAEMKVGCVRADDPVRATWTGAARLASRSDGALLRGLAVSRHDYFEHGENWVLRQFASRA